MSASRVVAADVSVRVVVSSAAAVDVVTSSDVAVIVVTSTVVVVSDKAILEIAKMVLVSSAVEPEVIVAASETKRQC